MATKLESSLERQVVLYCKANNVLCYKFVSPNKRGVPDRLLIGPYGEIYFLELKREKEMPSPLQWREIGILNKHCVRAGYVDNFEDAKTIINTLRAL